MLIFSFLFFNKSVKLIFSSPLPVEKCAIIGECKTPLRPLGAVNCQMIHSNSNANLLQQQVVSIKSTYRAAKCYCLLLGGKTEMNSTEQWTVAANTMSFILPALLIFLTFHFIGCQFCCVVKFCWHFYLFWRYFYFWKWKKKMFSNSLIHLIPNHLHYFKDRGNIFNENFFLLFNFLFLV